MTTETIHKDEKLKILSLEDSARDFELIKELLIDAGYCLSITWVETEDTFAASLRDQTWDLILADFKLPGFDAFGALRLRNEICPDTPFICVSGSIGEETAIELLKAGAVDYVLKDRPDRLPFAVGRAMEEARQKKIRQQNTEALQEAYRQLRASQSATLNILEDLQAEILVRQAREAELQRITLAVEQAGEVVMITDPDGTIQYVNPAFTDVSGYSREESVGQNPRLLKSGQQDEAFYQELWGTVSGGRSWKGRTVNKRKDGTLYTEAATISPVKDNSGGILSYVAVKRDITEHLRAEEEREKLQVQFLHAQKMESIGTLAGGVAHDFNNILTAITGFVYVALLKTAPDNAARGPIEQIRAAADRAASLTRELLLFSRRQPADFRSFDLNELLERTRLFLERTLGADITLNSVPHATPLPVLADAHQLQQVLMNLAINARDAMPEGGYLSLETSPVSLNADFVAAHSYGQPGRYALLSVSDNGQGMDKAVQAHIFEPFFTTKTVGQGTGLGLAVVYGIIKQHGGFINVYSEPGHGTTFRIYLPLKEVAAAPLAETDLSLDKGLGGSETILVAEDDAMVRALVTQVLSEAGYRVIPAVDGQEALRQFKEHAAAIDLLLFDLIMPKMNGKEVLDIIRQQRFELPVIFVSGYAPESVKKKVDLAPNAHLLHKPMAPDTLLRKVRSVLDQRA